MRPLTYTEFAVSQKEAFTFGKNNTAIGKKALSEWKKLNKDNKFMQMQTKLNIKVILGHCFYIFRNDKLTSYWEVYFRTSTDSITARKNLSVK